MKNKKQITFAGIFLAALVLALAIIFSACNHHAIVSSQLDGAWVSAGGERLVFNQGAFSRTGGIDSSGSFSQDNGYITFFARGQSSIVLPYELNFPRLQIGITAFYRDSTRRSDIDLVGLWNRFIEVEGIQLLWRNPIIFRPPTPQLLSPDVLQGTYVIYFQERGIYKLEGRHLPGSDILTLTPTHISGVAFALFVERDLPADLMELFEIGTFDPPFGVRAEDWFFSMTEINTIFEGAMANTQSLQHREEIALLAELFRGDFTERTFRAMMVTDITLGMYPAIANQNNRLELSGGFGTFFYARMSIPDFTPGPYPDQPDPNQPDD